MTGLDQSDNFELTPEQIARLEADTSSILRYFLDLAQTVQDVADRLKNEAYGRRSCHHPALQADHLEYVARHLRSFAVHPDCSALDAMNGLMSAVRKSLSSCEEGLPVAPWRRPAS